MTSPHDGRLKITSQEALRAPESRAAATPGSVANQIPPPPRASPRGGQLALVAVAIGLSLLVLVGSGVMVALALGVRENEGPDPPGARSVRPASDAEQRSISRDELALVAPTVEGSASGVVSLQHWSGSAVPWRLIDGHQLILVTNRHVSSPYRSDRNASLEVTFGSGKKVPVRNVALPTGSGVDLALLLVDASSLTQDTDYCLLTPCPQDRWPLLKPGDDVVAVGSSLGYPQTQTFGRISAVRQGLPNLLSMSRWIQFDATILPGNSGGPLLQLIDSKWRWVGIVTAGGQPGVGFAIFAGELFQTSFEWMRDGGPLLR